jgi:hypothetical protein
MCEHYTVGDSIVLLLLSGVLKKHNGLLGVW